MFKECTPKTKKEIKQSIRNLDILNAIRAGLSLINKDMRIIWINKTMAEWFGSPSKIRGTYCYQTYQHRDKICPECPTYKAFKTGKVESHPQIGYTKKGEKRYYQLTTAPVKNEKGKTTYVLELVQDITKQVEIEQEKNQAKEKLSTLNEKLKLHVKELKEKTKALQVATNTVKRLNLSLERKVRQKTKNIEILYRELLTIFEISKIISSTTNIKEIFSLIAKTSCELLSSKASTLTLLDDNKKSLAIVGNFGLSKDFIDNTPLQAGEGIAGLIIKNRKSIMVSDVEKDKRIFYSRYLQKYGIGSILGVPVLFNGDILGTLMVYKETGQGYAVNDELILSTFATQAAIAIKNAQLHKSVNETYLDTINTLVLTVEARDPYTQGHSSRVTRYSIDIAKTMGIPETEIDIIRRCGKLHDIGKIAVPDQLLKVPKRLSITEKAQIELHPIIGVRIIAPLKFLEYGIPLIRYHHERYDGSGYPDGLRGNAIPLIVRILTIADAFDAMTSDRPYRTKMSIDEAIKELEINSGTQFDPVVVEVFLRILRKNTEQ